MVANKTGLFRKISDSIISLAGYVPVRKDVAVTPAKFRSIALNTQGGFAMTEESIKKNGLRKPSNVSFKILREIAKKDALIRICINVIKKSVSQSDWVIKLKDGAPMSDEYYSSMIAEVYELFEFMNANGENMRILLDRILEDLLVLDAGAIEIVRTIDKTKVVALNSVDAATIRPVYNQYGELGSDVAYVQYVNSKKMAEFDKQELVYMMANPQNDVDQFGYGLSPIESILLQVQASLEADMYNIKHFSKDNIPPGMLDLGNMTTEQAEEFIAIWNATVVGNTHGMKFVWGSENGKKYIPFNTSNKDMQYSEYIDWLSRIKLATYGLSGIDANIFQDVNRGTAEVQQSISSSRGVKSAKRLIEEYFTRQIIRQMGPDFKWIEFSFVEAESLKDKKIRADIDKIYVDSGVMTPNEIREREGMGALEEDDFEEEINAAIRADIEAEPTPLEEEQPETEENNEEE